MDKLDLKYGNIGEDILKPGQKLMELKIAGAMSIEMAHILSELKVNKVSFSKYGRGYLDYMYPYGVQKPMVEESTIINNKILSA